MVHNKLSVDVKLAVVDEAVTAGNIKRTVQRHNAHPSQTREQRKV